MQGAAVRWRAGGVGSSKGPGGGCRHVQRPRDVGSAREGCGLRGGGWLSGRKQEVAT